MADAAQQWGRRALDFVDAVERLSAPAVIQLFEAEIKACGFHAYIMAGLPSPGTSLSDLTVANGWPPERFELYTRENFSAMDPEEISMLRENRTRVLVETIDDAIEQAEDLGLPFVAGILMMARLEAVQTELASFAVHRSDQHH